ncbi:2-oxo acid dehydrogenase subunit E2 [Pontixanthobacter aquaemixtae]|uniref:Pyruvate dehydrogenase complex dihydrolipoamide acetyltransferase n=1 Tax=Pontixanthobacter aquaemixtae TaxID=1958940 RepID=A0A844ZSA7_9SPHN|nr:2-oxo acid dehydrogenase subunit E2 [Pontixanthobacter aquaemixtae]MXO90000.1 pyruvate dehydrogenase complex dihydrolipoamide acetyltransferase [Pontixanthobacter aquaemixtae]
MSNANAPAASPSARKLAEEKGIDLASISGTGPAGKITKADVENAPAGTPQPSPDTSAPADEAPAPDDAIAASPLAKRIAAQKGLDLSTIKGSGPGGRIVKADVENAEPGGSGGAAPSSSPANSAAPDTKSPSAMPMDGLEAPFEVQALNGVRKVIARRLTEAKQTIPHIYLSVDVHLDALLTLRGELNASLEADGVKLSVNDLLIKALARALMRVPACNVSFQGDDMHRYSRADISVAVAAPSGLITPIIRNADGKGVSEISSEMKGLAAKARDGKLQAHEFQGGTASLSNLGMFGIKHFDAVINPPQGMILAVGAGEQRPYIVENSVQQATVMSVTGSFDHRAIDGADGAQLMQAFKDLVEKPMGLLA